MPTLTAPDLSKLERPNVELPDVDLSRIELPKFDLPKVDVGKAVTDAATAVGLMKKPRSRWPFIVGAGIAVAVAGWAWMNADMIRRRLSDVASMVGERIGEMRGTYSDDDEAVAFPAADTAPSTTDYPNGFGSPTDMAGATEDDILALDKVTARS